MQDPDTSNDTSQMVLINPTEFQDWINTIHIDSNDNSRIMDILSHYHDSPYAGHPGIKETRTD